MDYFARLTVDQVQAMVARLDEPPEQMRMWYGPAPMADGRTRLLWHARAYWGGHDHCTGYGASWIEALRSLAMALFTYDSLTATHLADGGQ